MSEQQPLIDIFSGARRRLGAGDTGDIFIQLYKSMQTHLCEFPKSSLYIFLALAFHMDKNGWCFPAIETIAKNTGKNPTTVSSSIEDLCKINIDGYRIFLKVSARDTEGKLASNRYLIHPSTEEVARFDGKTVIIDNDGNILGTEEEYKSGQTSLTLKLVQSELAESITELTGTDYLAGEEPEIYDEGYYTGLLELYYKAKEEKKKVKDRQGITLTPQIIISRVIGKLFGDFVFNGPLISKIVAATDSPFTTIRALGEIRKTTKKELTGGKLQYLLVCVQNWLDKPKTSQSVLKQSINLSIPVKDSEKPSSASEKAALMVQLQRAKQEGNTQEIKNLSERLKGIGDGK